MWQSPSPQRYPYRVKYQTLSLPAPSTRNSRRCAAAPPCAAPGLRP
jgi:hypothetical protein